MGAFTKGILVFLAICFFIRDAYPMDREVNITSHTNVALCPSGWTQFSGYCYIVNSTDSIQDEAKAHCEVLGGELVKINSTEENQFVVALGKKEAPSARFVWMGAEWSSQENDLLWLDQSLITYSKWAPGEPNGNANEPCVVLYLRGPLVSKWNDRYCGTSGENVVSVCETDADECQSSSTCGLNQDCKNTVGSYTCECAPGFLNDSGAPNPVCIDIDECQENQDTCPNDRDCLNLDGGHKCNCKSGFEEDETGTCVTKCKCGSHGKCVTDDGDCDCHDGYLEEEGVCKDTDECENNCKDENQRCTNNAGSYDCSCKGRYVKKTVGQDECTAIGEHEECDEKGKCKCKKGFMKKQGKCVQVSKLKGDATSIKPSSHVTILVIALLGRLALIL